MQNNGLIEELNNNKEKKRSWEFRGTGLNSAFVFKI